MLVKVRIYQSGPRLPLLSAPNYI